MNRFLDMGALRAARAEQRAREREELAALFVLVFASYHERWMRARSDAGKRRARIEENRDHARASRFPMGCV